MDKFELVSDYNGEHHRGGEPTHFDTRPQQDARSSALLRI